MRIDVTFVTSTNVNSHRLISSWCSTRAYSKCLLITLGPGLFMTSLHTVATIAAAIRVRVWYFVEILKYVAGLQARTFYHKHLAWISVTTSTQNHLIQFCLERVCSTEGLRSKVFLRTRICVSDFRGKFRTDVHNWIITTRGTFWVLPLTVTLTLVRDTPSISRVTRKLYI